MHLRAHIVFFAVLLACHQAQATDIYNFYFQKIESSNSIKNKKIHRELTNWSFRAGLGQIHYGEHLRHAYSQSQFIGSTDHFSSNTFVLGTRYHFNRYFDTDVEIQIPVNGFEMGKNRQISSIDGTPVILPPDNSIMSSPAWSIGGGFTPLLFDVFGPDSLLISIVGGFLGGKRIESIGEGRFDIRPQVSAYLGSRLLVRLSDRISGDLSILIDQNYQNLFHATAALNYRF